MSPRTALLILVLASAAESTKYSFNSGSMIRSLLMNNLDMALALSRLPPVAMSMVGKDQSRARSTALVVGQYKKVWNVRKRLKVCVKCPTSFKAAIIGGMFSPLLSRGHWIVEGRRGACNCHPRT